MRFFLIVIDSFGIGAMPDAAFYGDAGSDTYGHVFERTGVSLDTLVSFGLNNIDGVSRSFSNGRELLPVNHPRAAHARLAEKTPAKDTTAGHYEIAGLVMRHPYRVYKKFPREIIDALEVQTGTHFLGNEAASGTEIIQRLGPEHLRTGFPILYTSADSVMQIAADTSVIPLARLYEICAAARKIMTGERAVGRVIARPFIHHGNIFTRTEDRRDYALEPPGRTMLDVLYEAGIPTVGVGKIGDIFCGRGISKSIHTGNNAEGLREVQRLAREMEGGLAFVNLVDTDMLYGHRNDVEGYAAALLRIDEAVAKIEKDLREEDILLLAADHGCDPSTPSTDHSREYVPLLIYGKRICPLDLGTIEGFDCIAASVLASFGLGRSVLYEKLKED